MNVGFVGLGNQGLPMAQMIERAGWPLTVWARRPETVEPFTGTAAEIAGSLVDLAVQCDVIGVCVRTDDDVREVVLGPGGLRSGVTDGSVVVIHSTVHPSSCEEIARELASVGVGVLDAPVSGSGPAALAKTLTVMVGGDRELFERVEPLFESYGAGFWLGPLGSGQRMKLLNNAVFMANLLLAYEAVDVAPQLGIDPESAEQVLGRSSGGSRALGIMARFREFPDLVRPRETLGKDLHHFDELVTAIGEPGGAATHLRELGPILLEHLAELDHDKRKRVSP